MVVVTPNLREHPSSSTWASYGGGGGGVLDRCVIFKLGKSLVHHAYTSLDTQMKGLIQGLQ